MSTCEAYQAMYLDHHVSSSGRGRLILRVFPEFITFCSIKVDKPSAIRVKDALVGEDVVCAVNLVELSALITYVYVRANYNKVIYGFQLRVF